MIFNGIKNYYYTADYYSYVVLPPVEGSNVTIRDYSEIPESFRLSLTTSFIGDLVLMTSKKMQIEGYITNLLDKTGKEVFENGLWRITQTQPVLNALGFSEGFKYKAKILSGNI